MSTETPAMVHRIRRSRTLRASYLALLIVAGSGSAWGFGGDPLASAKEAIPLQFPSLIGPGLVSDVDGHDPASLSNGIHQYRERNYDRALQTFMSWIQRHPGDPRLMEAQWMLAKTYDAMGSLAAAIAEYRSFLDNFPSTVYRDEALLRATIAEYTLLERQKASTPPVTQESSMTALPLYDPVGVLQGSDRVEGTSSAAAGDPAAVPRILGGQFLQFPVRSYEALDLWLAELRATGMNTLLVRMFQNQGDRRFALVSQGAAVGVYFQTEHAPVVADLLTPLTQMAHRHGLRVFAWMTTRTMDWISADVPWFDLASDPITGGAVKSPRLDLWNPEVVSYLKDLYRDLASYPIDGILLQDDLVYRHREGFSPMAAARFQHDFGVPLNPSDLYANTGGEAYKPLFWRWAGWKSREILHVADEIMASARTVHPGLSFVLNMNYESVTDPVHALAWFSQDFLEAQKHPFNYFAVMAYHRQMGKEMHQGLDASTKLVGRMAEQMAQVVTDPSRILLKMQAVDWETGLPVPPEELRALSDRSAEVPGIGLAFVFNGHAPSTVLLRDLFQTVPAMPGVAHLTKP